MRPLTLRIAGLRSYRKMRTLDFTDRSLIAILGDTGSGKSSLLEAIYGALYAGSTWDARGLGALIADGVKTLQIELIFTAHDKTYKVSRSISRDNYPPAKHVLDCLDDGEHIDGQTSVNRRIVQIVGLTDQEFLRVVILPQGRFGQLLQGTTGDRTPILRGILGLGVLNMVQQMADRQHADLADRLEPLTTARAKLYPDPALVAADAADDASAHKVKHDKLAAARTTITAIEQATTAVYHMLPAITAALAQARVVNLSATTTALAAADQVAVDLGMNIEKLSEDRRLHQMLADDRDTMAAASAAAGLTSESVARAEVTLNQLLTALPTIRQDALDHGTTDAELTVRETRLASHQFTVATKKDQATQARAALHILEIDMRGAEDKVRETHRQLAALQTSLTTLAGQLTTLNAAGEKLISAADVLRAAQHQSAAAQIAFDTAQENYDALLAGNHIAHVAQGHRPGEKCPVCERTLPANFTPPAIVGEAALTTTLTGTRNALQKATKQQNMAERVMDNQRLQLSTVNSVLTETSLRVTELADELGLSIISYPSSTAERAQNAPSAASLIELAITSALARNVLNGDDLKNAASALTRRLQNYSASTAATALSSLAADSPRIQAHLAPLLSYQTATKQTLDSAQKLADDLAKATAGSLATLTAANDQLAKDKRAHRESGIRITQTAQQLITQVRTLPPTLAHPLTTALNLAATDPIPALLAAPLLPPTILNTLRHQLEKSADELKTWRDDREAARDAILDIDRKLTDLAESRRELIDTPRASARTHLERAAGGIRALAASLPGLDRAWEQFATVMPNLPALPARDAELNADDAGIDFVDSELTSTCTAISMRMRLAYSIVVATHEAAVNGVQKATDTIGTLLAATGIATTLALTNELATAAHLLSAAQLRGIRAKKQELIATVLDEGLKTVKTQLAVLRIVKDQLNPSMFPKFVVQQRQTALLRIASTLLAKLTRDAFGFGDNFMIVDRRTGQPRHAKTLSGGETFLASLALALALVEISNRSGGQLDAIFLDEGFGSLDASILGDALDVLREQATSGRLVGVISHVHAVAAELDDVLVVTKEIDGSDFRWIDTEERDKYLLDNLSTGLLD